MVRYDMAGMSRHGAVEIGMAHPWQARRNWAGCGKVRLGEAWHGRYGVAS